jgi:hypothetical protein
MATRRPCTSPCPPPILANEFCRIFSIPRFIFAYTLSGAIAAGYIGPGPEGLGPEFFAHLALLFKGGQDRMLGLGFGLLFVRALWVHSCACSS